MDKSSLSRTPHKKGNKIEKLIATYAYNHLRQRVSKTVYQKDNQTNQTKEETTQYLWDKGLLSAEIKDDKVVRRYIYLDIMPVSVLDYGYDEKGKLNETKVYSIHTDHLGTPKAITNDKQETVWSIEMDTFGETQSIESKDNFQFNLRFAGQYFDQESGYHYNYHRYYNPETGRYLTSDPIELWSGDTNTYIYVNNQPWYGIDLWGLYAISQVDYMRLVGVTDKALAGRMFDADMNASNYLFFHNTTKFNSSYRKRMTLPRSQKFTSVIPDNTGIFDYTKLSRNPYTVLKNISINKLHFEFKLTSTKSLSISYNDYQLSRMIDVLQKTNIQAKNNGRNGLVIVTGSNTKIGRSLINFANKNNVALYHSIAEVDDSDCRSIHFSQPILQNPTNNIHQLAAEIIYVVNKKVNIGQNGVDQDD